MELDCSVTVIGSPDVVIDLPPLELVDVQPGPRSWRRHTVEGRYQHGRAMVGAV